MADVFSIEDQICFSLYVCSKELVKRYNERLEEFNLTYTQYLALMSLYESGTANVKELGKKLFLDSGTLTPLLKSLEKKGYLTRNRSMEDERQLLVSITEAGCAIIKKVSDLPIKLREELVEDEKSIECLQIILRKTLKKLRDNKGKA